MKLASNSSNSKNPNFTNSKYVLIPSILMMGFVPLIMHTYTENTGFEVFDWWANESAYQTDFSLFYKSVAIIIIAITMAFILFYRKFNYDEELPWKKQMWFLAVYGIFVFLSGVFSKYPGFAFKGTVGRYESVLVIFGYLLTFYYTYTYINTEEHVWYFLKGVSYFTLVEFAIAIAQGLGFDILNTKVGKIFYTSPSMWKQLDTIETTMPKHAVYGTLYHPDYFSAYLGILIPVFVSALIAAKIKKDKIYFGIVALLAIFTFYLNIRGYSVISGLLALIAGLIIVWIIASFRNKKIFACTIAVFGCLLISGVVVYNTNNKVHSFAQSYLESTGTKSNIYGQIKGIETNDDDAALDLADGREIHFTYDISDDNSKLDVKATDADGNEIPLMLTGKSSQTYTSTDPAYTGLVFRITSNLEDYQKYTTVDSNAVTEDQIFYFLKVTYDNHDWNFIKYDYAQSDSSTSDDTASSSDNPDYTYLYVNDVLKAVKVKTFDVAEVFPNRLFNGRGGIWNHVLPLIKHTVFLGTGANTFLAVFPQDDYLWRVYMEWPLTAKDHSMYFQQLLENGWIGTAGLIVFFIYMFIRMAVACVRKDKSTAWYKLMMGVFVGLAAYLILGIANDSMVTEAPIAWTAFGLGFASVDILDGKKNNA